MKLCHSLLFLALAGGTASAQWLNYKTPGIPRLADGKPNLAAPAPRTTDGKPDLSGLWRGDTASGAEISKAMDSVKAQPWAVELKKKRMETYSRDNPTIACLPPGLTVDMDMGKVVQTPHLLLMLFGGTLYRSVYLDGRPLEKNPNPDWMGYSVGHWEGDTLIIESNGFNDRTWLNFDGYPHTEALRVTERIRRPDFGHLDVVRTFTDPGALLEPWTVPVKFEIDADTEDIEYVCNENEKDRGHLVGKASDEKNVKVAPEILARYVGSFEFKIPETGQPLTVTFAVDGDRLVMSGAGPTAPLNALSDKQFSGAGATIEFIPNAAGAVNEAIVRIVEGDLKGVRK